MCARTAGEDAPTAAEHKSREHTRAFVTVAVCVCASLCVLKRVSGSKRVNPQGDEGSVCL